MYYYWGFGIFMYNLKMSKTDVNKLLLEVMNENVEYGLILSMQYIYGRNPGDVLELKKEDIDLNENTIKFRLSKSNLKVPIAIDIYELLVNHLNSLSDDEEYVFLNKDVDYKSNVLSKRINYYLNVKINELNKGVNHRLSKITNRDLKMLRGQHLYLENVPMEVIHELYNNFNYSETRNMIDYEGLNEWNNCSSVDDLINYHTDLNLFHDDDYNREKIFAVVDSNGDYSVVEFNGGGLKVYENDDLYEKLNELDVDDLYNNLKCLRSGEFKFIDGLKFLK